MALLFMDSFDHYATADLAQKYSTVTAATIQAATGRRGSQALRLGDGILGLITRSLPVTGNGIVIGIAVKTSSFPTSNSAVISVMSGAVTQCSLGLSSTGYVQAWSGDSTGTLLGTATTGGLTAGVFAYLELKATIHASAGTFTARVNGATVLALTGVNTAAVGPAVWDNIYFSGLTPVTSVDVDDLYILDGSGAAPWNDFLGDVRVDARFPTGAGAVTEWTPSTGANWQAVDDATPNGDTDYTAAATASLTDTFVVQDAPVAGAVIYGVQVNLSARKTDAGTCSLASVVRQSGSNQVATAQDPSTSYSDLYTVYQTNPHTAAQWIEADFNADEFGYRRTA